MSKISKISGSNSFLEKQFHITALGSTIQREIIAGFTTFAAMAYILVVNPDILKAAGMSQASLAPFTYILAFVFVLHFMEKWIIRALGVN